MHNCLVINDGEKTSLEKYQRISAKYLPHDDPIISLGSLQPASLVGLAVTPAPGTWLAQLMQKMLAVAALVHDTGKMSKAFQRKLWASLSGGKSQGEFIRHEALSYYILRKLSKGGLAALTDMLKLTAMDGAELAALVACKSANALKADFDALLAVDLQVFDKALRGRPTTSPENLVTRLIAYLSFTHHHLPGERDKPRADYTYNDSKVGSRHFNKKLDFAYKDCLEFERGNQFQVGSPNSLAPQLITSLAELEAHLKFIPSDFDASAFVRIALHFGRPTLILGDHLASALKCDSGLTEADARLLGNTCRDTLKSGDAFDTHTRSVQIHAHKQFNLALDLVHGEVGSMPQLSPSAQSSISAKRKPTGKYAWQHQAYAHIKATAKSNVPTFCTVTAETGSGKTIVSAQIAQALGSNRFTYCLGLRTLTLQTGDSYRKDLGLTSADLAVVIGDRLATKSFAAFGSESLEQSDLITAGDAQPTAWLSTIQPETGPDVHTAFSNQTVNFISAPVVVCTIDQLIGVARLTTVRKVKEFIRLYSSDLVLDEIDNYSPAELKHIQRLCYMVGLARHNVTCLSATMGYLHTEALLTAYRAGLADNNQLTGLGASVHLATISNVTAPTSLHLDFSVPMSTAMDHVAAFNQATITAQFKSVSKVTPRLLRTHALDFKTLTEEISWLHKNNSYRVANRDVSLGFARFNTVHTARSFARWLLTVELPADTEISIVCYHSRFCPLELWTIDRALNKLTNRKGLSLGVDLSAEALDAYIKPLAAATPSKNLICIVVASSILETGRDHDYDWCLLEPNSHRSLIQSAGRVRRHRDWVKTEANLSLIEIPVRALFSEDKPVLKRKNPVLVWSYPGPLSALIGVVNSGKLAATELAHSELLDDAAKALHNPHPFKANADLVRDITAEVLLAGHPRGIQSGIALQAPYEVTNPIALLEQYALFVHTVAPMRPVASALKSVVQVSALGAQFNQMYLSDWLYQEPFRAEAPDQEKTLKLQLVKHNVDTLKLTVMPYPLSELGAESNALKEGLKVTKPWRALLTLPSMDSTSDPELLLRALLQSAVTEHIAKGFSAEEIVRLSQYTPQHWSGDAETWRHPLLGYCHKQAWVPTELKVSELDLV